MEFYSQLADLILNIDFASFLCSSSLSCSPFLLFGSGSIRILHILRLIFVVIVSENRLFPFFRPLQFCLHLSPLRGSLPFRVTVSSFIFLQVLCIRREIVAAPTRKQNWVWPFLLNYHRYFRCTR